MKLAKIIYLLFFFLICQINIVLAQKRNIDSNTYTHWSSVEGAQISSDGKYTSYDIENEPLGSRTLVVQSTENSWGRRFNGASVMDLNFLYVKKMDYAIFINQNDSLVIASLGKNLMKCISNVSSFTSCKNGESEWIAYQFKQSGSELIIQNVITEKKYTYSGVINKVMDDDGQIIILQTEKKNNGQTLQELSWIDLSTGENTLIYTGVKTKDVVLDGSFAKTDLFIPQLN